MWLLSRKSVRTPISTFNSAIYQCLDNEDAFGWERKIKLMENLLWAHRRPLQLSMPNIVVVTSKWRARAKHLTSRTVDGDSVYNCSSRWHKTEQFKSSGRIRNQNLIFERLREVAHVAKPINKFWPKQSIGSGSPRQKSWFLWFLKRHITNEAAAFKFCKASSSLHNLLKTWKRPLIHNNCIIDWQISGTEYLALWNTIILWMYINGQDWKQVKDHFEHCTLQMLATFLYDYKI